MKEPSIDRLFEKFEVRALKARSKAEKEAHTLDLHRAVARHWAEATWLRITTDSRFLDKTMTGPELGGRVERALDRLLALADGLHQRHGLDAAFGLQARVIIIRSFYERIEIVGSIQGGNA